ncbi:MAG: hypothetical protein ACXWIU_13800 [Limisphaerales bacterium]
MRRISHVASFLTVLSFPAFAQSNDADLAKKLSNPISSLVSVPFQYNFDCCFGPSRANHNTLNVQPVIPLKLNENWNLIVRTILPVAYWREPAPTVGNNFGLGDTTQSFFLSPNATTSGAITWGVGPVFLYPSATDDSLGSQKWGAGPTIVVLKQEAGWTYGVLANYITSFASTAPNRSSVSSTFIQPFINYTWPDTFGITVNTESTYDFITNQWTVPINVLLSKIYKFGDQPVSLQFGPRVYLATPTDGPRWGLRFNATFLFPAK